MKKRVVVAMSGGVDSSVCALMLVRRGYDVTGLFMRTGDHGGANPRSCCSLDDGLDARRVADLLEIPFYALNFEEEFKKVIGYFVSEYERGRTPNPCIACNRDLKFGRLYDYAVATGADWVATGHYASVVERADRYAIRAGRDAGKDQSYVLFPLSQKQLGRTILPLGDFEKGEVRALALEAGLSVATKPDSQEICFVPAGGHRELLAAAGAATPGRIVDQKGAEVGRHDGFEFFTIGQRRGLGTAFGEPRYVTGVHPETAVVSVGSREDLLRAELSADGWVAGGRPEPSDGESFRAQVKIRYRHVPAPALVTGVGPGRVRVEFDEPQSAIAPGQAVVAYDDDVVLGGGWISRAAERSEA